MLGSEKNEKKITHTYHTPTLSFFRLLGEKRLIFKTYMYVDIDLLNENGHTSKIFNARFSLIK